MNRVRTASAGFLLTLLLLLGGHAQAVQDAGEPRLRPDGERWRIGYAEGEPFVNFAGNLYGTLRGLENLGWIGDLADLPYVTGQEDSRIMWEWLAANGSSPYLEFVEDAHWSFRQDDTQEALERLRAGDELDLMLVMGTSAGVALTGDDHTTPVLVYSSSDAVGAGIVESAADSGRDHVWAFIDPTRVQRQVQVFHDLIGFESMGIVHEDSELGRIYVGIDEIMAEAAARGFEVHRRFVSEPQDEDDRDRYHDEILQAHVELAERVDAMFVAIGLIESARLPEMLEPFYQARIPTFSQLGIEQVEQGVLLSVARSDFLELGDFNSAVVHRVLLGERPRDIPQVFVEAPRIAVNTQAAELIGVPVPFEVLLAADYVYHSIPDPVIERVE